MLMVSQFVGKDHRETFFARDLGEQAAGNPYSSTRYRDGIRLEHGPGASGIQLITLADDPIQGKDGIQTNAMSLYVNHFKTGMLMVNPAQADSFESHSRVWLDTENGYGISRKF